MDNSAIWKALGDPTRRGILDQLAMGPRTTGELASAFPDLSRFAIMKHLTILETARLITWRKEGRERWNSLNAVPLRQVYERWYRNWNMATRAGSLPWPGSQKNRQGAPP